MGSADVENPWRARWHGWRRARWSERRAFLVGLVLLPLVALSLHLLGVRRTIAWTARGRAIARPAAEEEALVDGAVTAIRRAQRHGLVEGTCLSRSLALRRLLARAGLTTDLRFGGRRHQGRFEAHAWLERGGTPIADTADIGLRFVPFASGGPAAPAGRNPAGRRPS